MISLSKQTATGYYERLVKGESVRAIAKSESLSLTTLHRYFKKYFGENYYKKSKSNPLRLVGESVRKLPARKQNEVKAWLEQNKAALLELEFDDCLSERDLRNRASNEYEYFEGYNYAA